MDDSYHNWIFMVLSIVSILACALIIGVYYRFRDLHYPAFTLVKDLTVLNLLYGLALVIPKNGAGCQIQGISVQFMSAALVFWTAVIAHSLNLNIIKNINIDNKFFRRRAIVGTLAFATLTTVAPFAGTGFEETAYGPARPWCWIDHIEPLREWQLGVFYIPCILIFLYDFGVTLIVLWIIHRESSTADSMLQFELPVRIRLWLYPWAILIPFGPCALMRMTDDMQDLEPACAISAPLSGIVTTLIYGLTYQVRSHLRLCKQRSGVPEIQQSHADLVLLQDID